MGVADKISVLSKFIGLQVVRTITPSLKTAQKAEFQLEIVWSNRCKTKYKDQKYKIYYS